MATKKASARKTAKTDARTAPRTTAPATATTADVVVRGRLASAIIGGAKKPQIVNPDHKLARDGKTDPVWVKAIRPGEYGHKRRKVGEVFELHTTEHFKALPSWVIDLEDAEPGQDEGTRGLHSGGREDDRIREERSERVDEKKFKKMAGKGAKNISDPTIIEDAIPLSEGGNERKPAANEKVV